MKAFDFLPPPQRTLPQMLLRQAEQFGDRRLLDVGGVSWDHRDPAHLAATRAGTLARAGIVRGDRVALMSSNRAEFLECFLGCGWVGAVSVPINTASMGPQIEYFLTNSQASLLLIEAAFLERLQTTDLRKTSLQAIWVLDATDLPDTLQSIPIIAWPAACEPLPPAPVGPGETLAILYTSGTTGPSKGVLCPHAQYYWWGVNTLRVLDVNADDVLCTTLPLFHINALNTFAQATLVGCRVVFEPRFSASGFWASMRACGATVVYLLGAMVPILLAQPAGPNERGHRVRTGLGPGVPSAAAADFLARTGVNLLEGYGSTESSFVIATTPDSPQHGVMGKVLPGFQARVADEDDVELPPGVAGELLLRADEPYAFASGYFNMPEKTVETWRNLWLHTGDRVTCDADGTLRFVDRIKDAIRRRGENISSYEVEQVLLSHPDVAAVAVFPVRSELAEDEVMAALTLRSGCTLEPAALIAWCAARLQYFAVPRYIDIVDDLPRTENGKIQKYKLRERGVTATTWEQAPVSRSK
ncbi:ATP-dependent acyl-CoA ligase [Alcaligenaceae bacterium CGII-47]|nr:ATP-dependent acyl-CoA ligase [Alcaligenaceae bacterium CGII-47]